MQKYEGGKRERVHHVWGVRGAVGNEVNKETLIEGTLNRDFKKMRE